MPRLFVDDRIVITRGSVTFAAGTSGAIAPAARRNSGDGTARKARRDTAPASASVNSASTVAGRALVAVDETDESGTRFGFARGRD